MDLPLIKISAFQQVQAVELDFIKMLIENVNLVLPSVQLVLVPLLAVNALPDLTLTVSIVLLLLLNYKRLVFQF
jgi:hypothetical protein